MRQTYTITVFTENHIGLLNRITIIFTRRNVNIHSLTVSESAIKGISKFTIVVENETQAKVEKVVGQIEKVVEVLKAFCHPNDEIVYQEIALYKVPTEALLASNKLESIIRQHNARILEVMPEYTIIEKTGHCEETQVLFEVLTEFGVKQFTRSGRVAVTRLSEELLTNYLKEIDEKELELVTKIHETAQ
jgi:acetolactate synthase-1/3 small subunit